MLYFEFSILVYTDPMVYFHNDTNHYVQSHKNVTHPLHNILNNCQLCCVRGYALLAPEEGRLLRDL